MKKNLSIIIAALALTITFVSCNIFQTENEVEFEISFLDFEIVGVVHNEGLDIIKNYISNNAYIIKDKNELLNKVNKLSVAAIQLAEHNMILTVDDYTDMTLSAINFVQFNQIDYNYNSDESLLSNPSGIIPDTLWNQFSVTARNFVLELVDIHETYTSLDQLYLSVENFLNLVNSSSISYEEKIAMYAGAYIAYYSNEYWTYNYENWQGLYFSYSGFNEESINLFNASSSSWRSHVRADVGGAILGGFVGARLGAISGAAAGGVGALPGALSGAIGGGIATACGASAASIIMTLF